MTRWHHANEARKRKADSKAIRLAACMLTARSFKEAAWRAGIPVSTAKRLRARIV